MDALSDDRIPLDLRCEAADAALAEMNAEVAYLMAAGSDQETRTNLMNKLHEVGRERRRLTAAVFIAQREAEDAQK